MREPVDDYRISPDGRVEAMYAKFHRHVYAWHSHPGYAFGVTETGAQGFRCRGEKWVSAAGMVMALNPDDPHDGHAAADIGYHYRMLYVAEDLVTETLRATTGRRSGPPLFAEPVLSDPALAAAVRAVPAALADGDRLRYDESVLDLVLRINAAGATRTADLRPGRARLPGRRLAAARDRLVSDPEVGLDELAELAGASRYALYRGFHRAFAMSPSQYRRQVRLQRARRRIADDRFHGDLAAVAVDAGFADQAHLTRWFVRTYGITPARYRAAVGGSSVDGSPAGEGLSPGGRGVEIGINADVPEPSIGAFPISTRV